MRDLSHITPIVSGISGALAIIAVVIRSILTRGIFALDDVLAIAALISALPMGIMQPIVQLNGFGKDIWTLSAEKITRVGQVRNLVSRLRMSSLSTSVHMDKPNVVLCGHYSHKTVVSILLSSHLSAPKA